MANITDGPVDELSSKEEEMLHSILDELETPEMDKFQGSLVSGWAISEFMAFLYEKHDIHLGQTDLATFQNHVSRLLFEFFDIDQEKVEEERALLLTALNKRMEKAVMSPPVSGFQVEMNVKAPDGAEETTVFEGTDTIIEPFEATEESNVKE